MSARAMKMRYDGSFDLEILRGTDASVGSAGDGTGACTILWSGGVLRVEVGDMLVRLGDDFFVAIRA